MNNDLLDRVQHMLCLVYWYLRYGHSHGEWHLNADKYAQCNRCGWVDKSVRFDLPEDA